MQNANINELNANTSVMPPNFGEVTAPPPVHRVAPKQPPPHPRDLVIEKAVVELQPMIDAWLKSNPLTMLEYLYILQVVMGRQLQAACLHERSFSQPAPKS